VYGRGSQMGFGPPVTPDIIKNLIIANGVVFIGQILSDAVTELGVVSPASVWFNFELWRPFTYMWLHSSGPWHILFNMFSLWMFGSQMALHWGEERFLRYYLVCGVGAGVLIATVPLIPWVMGLTPPGPEFGYRTLGASGAVMGCLLAYSFTWPTRTIQLLFPPIPIKAIWLIPFLFFMEFSSGQQGISHIGHLGGVVVGWVYLAREGRTPGVPTIASMKVKWRRYQMRQKLRSVHEEERRERKRKDDDKTFH
jgi:membrane associated rhomboid family serine protease